MFMGMKLLNRIMEMIVKALLMDVLSVLHFHKDESIYFDSDSEVNKYLHDLVMNETSLNRK